MNSTDFTVGHIAGIDEAGRGPLAGAVIAAAVILNPLMPIHGLADSKKLSEKQRTRLFDEITTKALSWSLGRADPYEIDHLNILQATLLAMQRAVAGLSVIPDYALIDGNCCPVLSVPAKAIVKGDSLVAQISAASILAKVTRDREMVELHTCFPDYGFAQHKGYPTALHVEKLTLLGPTAYHRHSFAPVKKALEQRRNKEVQR